MRDVKSFRIWLRWSCFDLFTVEQDTEEDAQQHRLIIWKRHKPMSPSRVILETSDIIGRKIFMLPKNKQEMCALILFAEYFFK